MNKSLIIFGIFGIITGSIWTYKHICNIIKMVKSPEYQEYKIIKLTEKLKKTVDKFIKNNQERA